MIKALAISILAFGAQNAMAADMFSAQSMTGWVDVRLAGADGEKSWFDGGYGKLRYGHAGRADLVQAAVLWTPRFSDNVTAHVLAQDVPDARNPFGVSEAYFKWKPVPTNDTRYSFRLGQMFPPVSLEHDGPGWSTTRTLTPSAINSWVGEELLVDGVEASVQKTLDDHVVGATFGLYTSDDTAGTILAFRGWAEHDIASAGNTALPLPAGYGTGYSAVFLKQAAVSKPGVEVDGRMGYYGRLDWRPPAPVAFHISYLYNPGTPTIVKHGQYGWTTRFIEGGLQYQVTASNEILAQSLWGATKMGGLVTADRHAVDIDFDSTYVMLSHRLSDGARLSARLDYFQVIDYSWVDTDNNNEKGYSATLAWMKPLNDNVDLAVEAVHVSSRRPARIDQFEAADQSQNQVQIGLKLHL